MNTAEKIGFINQPSRQKLAQLIEEAITQSFLQIKPVSPLREAITYVLEGGKRIRPLLSLSLLCDLGKFTQKFLPAAIALEYLHTATLVHDDLPAIDNDDLRRGKKTCHKQFDEATAVLCGDILVALANEFIFRMDCSAEIQNEIARKLNGAFRDICYGQQLDLKKNPSKEHFLQTAQLKTGELFSATMVLPFIFIKSPKDVLDLVGELGLQIGVTYQIIDDIVDQDNSMLEGGNDLYSGEVLQLHLDKIRATFSKLSQKYSDNEFTLTKAHLSQIFEGALSSVSGFTGLKDMHKLL